MSSFTILPGSIVRQIIESHRTDIVDTVKNCYLTHYQQGTVNPKSHFLRFPEKPEARIIALPAYVGGDFGVAGIKWIASFPANIKRNVQRASAVLVLNDYETGYPFTVMEAATISAARTAASAVLGAEALVGSRTVSTLGFVGAGVISRTILDFFVTQKWDIGRIVVNDRVPAYADALAAKARSAGVTPAATAELGEALVADLVVLATTAATPYIRGVTAFRPNQTVLNISLRDLDVNVILNAHNVVDDIDHCLNANTSVHLAEQSIGNRGFINGTIGDLLTGKTIVDDDRPKVFSPFGLGVLDVSVGMFVYRKAMTEGTVSAVPDFFDETARW